MIYSVYNYGTKSYDYYDDGRPSPTHAGAPPVSATLGDTIGVAPEAAAWRLPIGVTKIGSGSMPRGRVATAGGMGDVDAGRLGMIAIGAYLAWRLLR